MYYMGFDKQLFSFQHVSSLYLLKKWTDLEENEYKAICQVDDFVVALVFLQGICQHIKFQRPDRQ